MANKPNNPALWSRAKSMAKQKFDVYPSAYANGWAAKWYKGKGGTWRKAQDGMEVTNDETETISPVIPKAIGYGMPKFKKIPLGFNFGLGQDDLYNLAYNISATGQNGDNRFSVNDPRQQISLSLLDGVLGKGRNLNIRGVKSKNNLDLGLSGSTPMFGGNLSVSGNYNYTNPNRSSNMEEEGPGDFMRSRQSRSNVGVNAQWEGKAFGQKGPRTKIGINLGNTMKDGGTNNPGFRALPYEVQQKIMNNMEQGGEKMPAEIARARFAAAGNLDQMSNYGYAYGGYIPEMMYGGRDYMQEGGEQDQVMQLIQMYAQMNQIDPAQLMEQLQQMPPEEQQQAIQQMAQTLEQGSAQQQPDMQQAAMRYGGYMTGVFAEGGEPNGGMALGQISAVADKMNRLRQFVSPEQNLDPWIASKLAVIDDSTASISDYMMYNPEAQGGGEEEEYEQEEMMEQMANGGYTVTRSNDRKGKTHKVTGPDGTVKYFGDSNLGQHPGNPKRKAAFYARHKTNLANNPFFRAFARKTWKEGGSTFSGNAFYQEGGPAFPTPYTNDYMDNMRKDYNEFYSDKAPNVPYARVPKNDDGYDAYYHSKIDGMPKTKIPFTGWTVKVKGAPDTDMDYIEDDGITSAPIGKKNRSVTRVDNGSRFVDPDTMDMARQVAYTQQSNAQDPYRKLASFMKLYQGGGGYFPEVMPFPADYSAEMMQQPDMQQSSYMENSGNFAMQMGGPMEGEVMDVSPDQLEMLRQQGYQFEIM